MGVNNSSIYAQSVTKKNETSTQTSKSQDQRKETKTKYTYKDSKGYVHPVYLSSTGKAFIKKKSKTTGKVYKQYLPAVGRQINPGAYLNKAK